MMTVRLIAHTPEPEKVVAAAAKLCYSDAHITDLLDGLDEEKTARFLTMLSDLGHASPIEHASFTFGIEGVSRTLLAQITRHRIASFSVQSQRYVRLDDFRYVIPPEIEAIPEAKAAFIESMNEDARRYLDLVQKLEDGHTARLMAEGLPEKQARAKASKQALGSTKRASSLACLEALARACFSGIPSAMRRAVWPSSSFCTRSRYRWASSFILSMNAAFASGMASISGGMT